MRRFLLTSTKFTGSAELSYGPKGLLKTIDVGYTDMNDTQLNAFIDAVPVYVDELATNGIGNSRSITIVETDFEVTFEQFWSAYPHKRNRFKVIEVWNKMNKAEQVKAFFSLPGMMEYKKKNKWYNIMLGDRFLKEKEYETDWKSL